MSDPHELLEADLAVCRASLAHHSKTFHAASLLLPPAVRAPATVLYGFCRLADDTVDVEGGRRLAITQLRRRLDRVFEGRPQPVAADRALAAVVARYGIPRALLDLLLEGLAWDVDGRRYETMDELQAYAARVAGSVGAMMSLLMGVRDPAALARACDLGVAMQLSNIARDVGEDARMGRIYLPMDELRRFEVPAAEILKGQYSERFTALMRFQAERARRAYDEAFALLPEADRRNQRAGLIMAGIYGTLLREIEASNFQVLHQRITLTPLRKLWIAWRIWVRATPPTWAS